MSQALNSRCGSRVLRRCGWPRMPDLGFNRTRVHLPFSGEPGARRL